MSSVSTTEMLFDDESNRKKAGVMTKLEVMFDDSRNNANDFWTRDLEEFLQWGKKYRISFEEVE